MTTDQSPPTGYDPQTPPWLQPATSHPTRTVDHGFAPGEIDLSGIIPPPATPVPLVAPPIPPPVRPVPRPVSPSPVQRGPMGPTLDEVGLIRKARRAPGHGWRRAVHTLTAGAVNPGESPADLEYRDLLERVRQPVRGDYRIAVLSLKGGVGKTTTTVGLGSTFASLRGDRVIAVDANPDLGTLAQRVPTQTASTVRDLLADPVVARYSDVRAHTSQAPSRLEVLASERDPAAAEAFNDVEYRGVMAILQRFYNIILTDCGTGMFHREQSCSHARPPRTGSPNRPKAPDQV